MTWDPREPSPRGFDPPQRSKSLNTMPLPRRTTVLLRNYMVERIERGVKGGEAGAFKAMLASLARFNGENPIGVELGLTFLVVKVPTEVVVKTTKVPVHGREGEYRMERETAVKDVKAEMARIQFEIPGLGPIGWLPMALTPTNPTLKRIAHEADPSSVPVLPLAPWESSEGEERRRAAFPPKPGTFLFRGKRG